MTPNDLSSEKDDFQPQPIKQQFRRKLSFWIGSATLVSGLLLAGIVLHSNGRVANKDMATLVRENTKFTLDLYKQLASETTTENIFFSPYSISTALAMTSAGARGETATQMNRVLSFTLPPTTFHPAFAQLTHQLTNVQGFQLSIANRLWAQNNFSLLPPFVKTTEDFYGAKIESLNFANPIEATRAINNWVSERTQNQIKDLLNQCDVGKDTKLVLTNAIYFKGNWEYKFKFSDTDKAPFTLASGKEEEVQLMYQSNRFAYTQMEDLQVLEMPYQGNKLSMVILLPSKPDGLPNLERNLTTANLEKWLSVSEQTQVKVWLPKFKFEQRVNLKDTLSKMGMPDAFKSDKADFSGMTEQTNLPLSKVIHKAFVEVEEEGAKAAAATAVIMGGNCNESACPSPMLREMLFRADHPFLFLIKDRESGSILFMGKYANPIPPKEEGSCP